MIRVEGVWKGYKRGSFFGQEYVEVLRDINVEVRKGEHVGIIGESGAGKSTLCRVLSLLELPDKGNVYLYDEVITRKNIKYKRGVVGMVFQDPATSLDPTMRIKDTLREAKSLSEEELSFWLSRVGLNSDLLDRKPGQLSGGQQQRVAIARAIIGGAEYVIFDEFTSALDVSTQAKIVNMLCDLNKDREFGFVFVSHDVKLIGYLSDRIYVIYRGEIVEELKDLDKAKHPYTVTLLNNKIVDSDVVESNVHKGCAFYSVCRYKMDKCLKEKPTLKQLDSNSKVRCFLYD